MNKKETAHVNKTDDAQCIPREIPEIPGLDILDGLKRLGGSPKLYMDLVNFLCNDKKNFRAEIEEAICGKDFLSARIHAHALKGSAATISATDLTEAARILECACFEENEEKIREKLYDVDRAIQRLVKCSYLLRECLKIDAGPEKEKKDSPKSKNIACLFPMLRNLEEGLRNLDPIITENIIEEITHEIDITSLESKSGELFSRMTKYARNYMFDKALEVLSQLENNLASRDQ